MAATPHAFANISGADAGVLGTAVGEFPKSPEFQNPRFCRRFGDLNRRHRQLDGSRALRKDVAKHSGFGRGHATLPNQSRTVSGLGRVGGGGGRAVSSRGRRNRRKIGDLRRFRRFKSPKSPKIGDFDDSGDSNRRGCQNNRKSDDARNHRDRRLAGPRALSLAVANHSGAGRVGAAHPRSREHLFGWGGASGSSRSRRNRRIGAFSAISVI